jgi:DNA polymerase I-like protein with 3'-5' exonuclease and polymerase domains
MAADLRIKQATGGQLPLALQVHDELIYVVDEHIAQPVLDLVIQEISRVPDWLPSIPLAAEGSFGISYGACKG